MLNPGADSATTEIPPAFLLPSSHAFNNADKLASLMNAIDSLSTNAEWQNPQGILDYGNDPVDAIPLVNDGILTTTIENFEYEGKDVPSIENIMLVPNDLNARRPVLRLAPSMEYKFNPNEITESVTTILDLYTMSSSSALDVLSSFDVSKNPDERDPLSVFIESFRQVLHEEIPGFAKLTNKMVANDPHILFRNVYGDVDLTLMEANGQMIATLKEEHIPQVIRDLPPIGFAFHSDQGIYDIFTLLPAIAIPMGEPKENATPGEAANILSFFGNSLPVAETMNSVN